MTTRTRRIGTALAIVVILLSIVGIVTRSQPTRDITQETAPHAVYLPLVLVEPAPVGKGGGR